MNTAVLVIDMQNGFCHDDGSLPSAGIGLPNMQNVIAENAALLATAREHGLPIIYTRHVYRPGGIEIPAIMKVDLSGLDRPMLIRGSWDADVVDELKPTEADYIIDKNRFDAFLYTELEVILRGLGIQRLLVTGVVTSVCVESTVRSGQQRDFEMMVASDCTSAAVEAHEPALAAMAAVFADVAPWRDLVPSRVEVAAVAV